MGEMPNFSDNKPQCEPCVIVISSVCTKYDGERTNTKAFRFLRITVCGRVRVPHNSFQFVDFVCFARLVRSLNVYF